MVFQRDARTLHATPTIEKFLKTRKIQEIRKEFQFFPIDTNCPLPWGISDLLSTQR